MQEKILNFFVTVLAIAYSLAAPSTFVYIIANVPHWTWLNAVPLVITALISSTFWWIYWPLHLFFNF